MTLEYTPPGGGGVNPAPHWPGGRGGDTLPDMHPPRRPGPRLLIAAALAWAPVLAVPLRAQVAAPSPEEVAEDFNRGFQSMAWAGLVQRIHPEALRELRIAADILVNSDTTGYVLGTLLGGVDPVAYTDLPDAEAVERLLAGVQREIPGLLSSLVSRRTQVLGVVAEGDARHVVYRIRALVQGAEPRVQVMTLTTVDGRWRVRDAEDLRVLRTAVRGIPIPRRDLP